MTLESNLAKQLELDEGNLPYVYPDIFGYYTIGIGILVDKRKGGGLRPEEVQFIFENRMRLKKAELLIALPWVAELDDARLGALLNMAYQMGVPGLLKFVNALYYLKARLYEQAAEHFKDSLWYKQTPERAKRICQQIRTGEWQFAE